MKSTKNHLLIPLKNESLYEVKALNKTINRNNFCGARKKWEIFICDFSKKKCVSYIYVYSVRQSIPMHLQRLQFTRTFECRLLALFCKKFHDEGVLPSSYACYLCACLALLGRGALTHLRTPSITGSLFPKFQLPLHRAGKK